MVDPRGQPPCLGSLPFLLPFEHGWSILLPPEPCWGGGALGRWLTVFLWNAPSATWSTPAAQAWRPYHPGMLTPLGGSVYNVVALQESSGPSLFLPGCQQVLSLFPNPIESTHFTSKATILASPGPITCHLDNCPLFSYFPHSSRAVFEHSNNSMSLLKPSKWPIPCRTKLQCPVIGPLPDATSGHPLSFRSLHVGHTA